MSVGKVVSGIWVNTGKCVIISNDGELYKRIECTASIAPCVKNKMEKQAGVLVEGIDGSHGSFILDPDATIRLPPGRYAVYYVSMS